MYKKSSTLLISYEIDSEFSKMVSEFRSRPALLELVWNDTSANWTHVNLIPVHHFKNGHPCSPSTLLHQPTALQTADSQRN